MRFDSLVNGVDIQRTSANTVLVHNSEHDPTENRQQGYNIFIASLAEIANVIAVNLCNIEGKQRINIAQRIVWIDLFHEFSQRLANIGWPC